MSKFKKRIEVLIELGILGAVVMHGINKFIESKALVDDLCSSAGGDFFDWSHGSIFYKKTGEGSPLLLIHDLHPASSMVEWNEVLDDLALDHTVYLLDLPGCGRSDKLDNETYINYFYVRMLKDFIDEVIGEPTDIIATGVSCSFVTMAAYIHADVIKKLTFINPENPSSLTSPIDVKAKITKALLDCPILGTFLYYIETSTTQLEYYFTERLFHDPFKVTSKLIHTYYEAAHLEKGRGKHLLASLRSRYLNANIVQSYSSLNQDITLLFGQYQPNASSIAKSYLKINPKTKVSFIPRAKMLPQLEAPAKLLHFIIEK